VGGSRGVDYVILLRLIAGVILVASLAVELAR